jgi:Tfp pilus assembly protein PilF
MKRILMITFSVVVMVSCLSALSCRKKAESAYPGVDRYNQGVSYLESANYKEAIVEFTAALEADPDNFEALKNLAGAYAYDGNWTQALERYRQALIMRPNDASICVNLAQTYRHLNDPESAWEMLRTGMDKDPNYAMAHYVAGELFMDMGDKDNAIAAFSDYISLEPGSMLADRAQATIDGLNSGDIVAGTYPESTVTEEGAVDEAAEEPLDEVTDETTTEGTEDEATQEENDTETTDETTPDETAEEPATDEEQPATEEPAADDTETTEPAADDTTEEQPEVTEPELPDLEGDALYQDRLSRGRRMRAIGSTSAAIRLLLEAYGVHPDYAQVNYELGMAYLADGQTENGKTYLEKYLTLETDEDAKAEVEARLRALESEESE